MPLFAKFHFLRTASCALLLWLATGSVQAADEVAFPERFMIRIGSYSVQDADTDIAVGSSGGGNIGTSFSFAKDLGGDESATVPRIDLYYRFNDRHRIDFSHFSYDRGGRELLELEVSFEDETFAIGDTLVTDIEYDLFKIAYGYSFYHSDRVELGFTAGFNITSYSFEYERDDGTDADDADATGPLPMFGLRISYAISPRWSLHYLAEAFYIELGDELSGAFTTNELNIQYRFGEGFVLGAGLSRFSTDLEADDSEWRGRIADSHNGVLVYGGYAF